jgi:hypothetical protein
LPRQINHRVTGRGSAPENRAAAAASASQEH